MDFLPIKGTFEDEVDRRTMGRFLWIEDSDDSDCDFDIENKLQATNEIVNISSENQDRGNLYERIIHRNTTDL